MPGKMGTKVQRRWADLLQVCRETPGAWMRFEGAVATPTISNINSVAHHIRRGRYKGIVGGDFEVRVDHPVMWIRFTGNTH